MNAPRESLLVAQLRELHAALLDAGIGYMLIGGLAVNIHGYVRATRDLDIMLAVEDGERAHALVSELGYAPIDRREDVASYVRGSERIDMLFASRPISRRLLERSPRVSFGDMQLPAVSLEGLIGLKVQAVNDDPRRLKDLADIVELFKLHRHRLDLDEVRTYFRLFDCEAWLDDLLRATH